MEDSGKREHKNFAVETGARFQKYNLVTDPQ